MLLLSGIGSGTYGAVFRVAEPLGRRLLASKRVALSKTVGVISVTSVRELSALLTLASDFVVRLFDLFFSRGYLYMVFESMSADLKRALLSFPGFMGELSVIRRLYSMLMSGLS
jgi:serine/threonine protein kinase